MIVQVSMVRDELTLIKELLPIWSEYADAFVFLLERNTDDSKAYLNSVKDKYNILEILEHNPDDNALAVETNMRQTLFDAARKYSNNIICLDADEYLDGTMTKQELEQLLENNPNTVYHLQWMQYTSVNTIRVDGPWKNNYKDRIGTYQDYCKFAEAWIHSTHLPIPQNQQAIHPDSLRIVHLQWLDKKYVAIKQYYWKVYDYVNNLNHGVDIVGNSAYDSSVNNFNWEEEYVYDVLKISPHIFESLAQTSNYRLKYIQEQTQKHNIPNLGDWGYNILTVDESTKSKLNPYKISVITAIGPISIYGKFLQRYLDNVIEQHFFQQTEHVIVYSEWHESFNLFLKYPNFKLVKEDEQRGVYNAWNIGIQAATTDYVTNWNVDDIRHPINTKIKYDVIIQNNCDVVYNWYYGTDNPDLSFYNMDQGAQPSIKFPDEYEKYAKIACLIGPDPLWKKSLHTEVGYFDYENFNTIGDWEMWIRFAEAGAKFRLIPEILCIYLDHQSTISQRQLDKAAIEKQKLYKKYT